MLKLFTKKKEKETIDKAIHEVLCYMSTFTPDSEEYTKANKNLQILSEAQKALEKKRVSADAIFNGVLFVGTTVLVLYFEKGNVITSKIFNSVFRGRV